MSEHSVLIENRLRDARRAMITVDRFLVEVRESKADLSDDTLNEIEKVRVEYAMALRAYVLAKEQ